MNIDFPLILVLATFFSGLVWLVDSLLFARRRAALATSGGAVSRTASPMVATGKRVPEPALVEYCRSFFPVLLIVLLLRSFLIEPFQIPSGSMRPTLVDGDFILVNKFSYGIRLPVLNKKVISLDDPESGDVVVFRYPEDGKTNFIKRVVGVPGDVIRYDDKTLYINDERVPERFLTVERTVSDSRVRVFDVMEEDLQRQRHRVLKEQAIPSRGDGMWVIPAGHYFVMGDNRDNSNDSRFWGLVPDENIVGKAFAIWMHWDDFLTIPSFSRVGAID